MNKLSNFTFVLENRPNINVGIILLLKKNVESEKTLILAIIEAWLRFDLFLEIYYNIFFQFQYPVEPNTGFIS